MLLSSTSSLNLYSSSKVSGLSFTVTLLSNPTLLQCCYATLPHVVLLFLPFSLYQGESSYVPLMPHHSLNTILFHPSSCYPSSPILPTKTSLILFYWSLITLELYSIPPFFYVTLPILPLSPWRTNHVHNDGISNRDGDVEANLSNDEEQEKHPELPVTPHPRASWTLPLPTPTLQAARTWETNYEISEKKRKGYI